MRAHIERSNIAPALFWLGLGAFLSVLLLASGFNPFETPPFESLEAVAFHNRIGITNPPSRLFEPGINGLYYPIHEPGTLLLMIPLAKLAGWLSLLISVPFRDVLNFLTMFPSALFFSLTYVAFIKAALALRLSLKKHIPLFTALLLSSQYLLYGTYSADVSVGACLFALILSHGITSAMRRGFDWCIAGFYAGLAISVKLSHAAIAPPILLLALLGPEAWELRLKKCAAFAAGLAPGLLILAAWNYIHSGTILGSPWDDRTAEHGFLFAKIVPGMLEAVVSPGKGILSFNPILILLPFFSFKTVREDKFTWVVLLSFLIAWVRLSAMPGGSSWGGWGNRYYIPWIPALMFLLSKNLSETKGIPSLLKALIVLLVSFGFVENFSGIITNFHFRQQLCGFESWTFHGTNACAMQALAGNLGRVAGLSIPETIAVGVSERNVFISNRMAIWWYGLQTHGVSAPLACSIGVVLFSGSVSCWIRGFNKICR